MATNFIIYFAGALVFCSLFYSTGVTAIYCFQCNSYYDPDCENIQPNDTSSAHYKLCDPVENADSIGKELFCRKIVQTIYDRDGMVRVIRKCGWMLHKRDCYVVSNKGHQDISCQCFHDGCNAAQPSITKSSVVIFLSIVPLLYLFS